MKAKVIRSFIDKYTMQDIDKGMEIEITEERFLELTEGPRGIFVEEIKEVPPAGTPTEPPKGELTQDEAPQTEEPKRKSLQRKLLRSR